MENRSGREVKQKILAAAVSASTGLAGMAVAARCAGGGCGACLGCAVPAVGIVLFAFIRKVGTRNCPRGTH